jgi:hypothetical protein
MLSPRSSSGTHFTCFTGTEAQILYWYKSTNTDAPLFLRLRRSSSAHPPSLLPQALSLLALLVHTNADALAAAAGASMSLPNLAKARVPDT